MRGSVEERTDAKAISHSTSAVIRSLCQEPPAEHQRQRGLKKASFRCTRLKQTQLQNSPHQGQRQHFLGSLGLTVLHHNQSQHQLEDRRVNLAPPGLPNASSNVRSCQGLVMAFMEEQRFMTMLRTAHTAHTTRKTPLFSLLHRYLNKCIKTGWRRWRWCPDPSRFQQLCPGIG